MIKNFYVTGDTHGDMTRFDFFFTDKSIKEREEMGIIILGDAGCNFYKSTARQDKVKEELEKHGCNFYLVRGNHEDRPENIEDMIPIWHEEIKGIVWYQPKFPHIFYLKDGETYAFCKYKVLIIGGAYSVDKWYRLANHWTWYPEEQLTEEEMKNIYSNIKGQTYDFVFTHTCPLSWEPRDLFLKNIDQSQVDKSMEKWLDKVKENINWDIWLFGHYHADRLERPHVEQFFQSIESLDEIWSRWNDSNSNLELELEDFYCSPNYNL